MSRPVSYLDGRVMLHPGDCLDVLRGLADASIDSCVTDPPYALVSITKRFGKAGAAAPRVPEGGSGVYSRASAGFMGKTWDTGERAFAVEFWAEVLRVLKPGGHVVAFGGTRTYHRLACAIEDAGFEIRDCIQWIYGSGFPKSHNQPGGWGTALKPANEPIVLARKPLDGTVAETVLRHGTGAINIDGCRIEAGAWPRSGGLRGGTLAHVYGGRLNNAGRSGSHALGRWPANVVHDGSDDVVSVFPDSDGSGAPRTLKRSAKDRADGWGMDANSHAATLRDSGKGSAARFFYSAKADAHDRIGSKHPTVKPVDLMQWLVRLVTPPRVLECPQCDRLAYGDCSSETSPDSFVRGVSGSVQAQGQRTCGEVLQPSVRGAGAAASADRVSVVRDHVPTEEGRGSKVLQQELLGEVDGQESSEFEGFCDLEERVSAPLDARSSPVSLAEGLHIRASLGDAAEDRAAADERGSSASHQRRERRQSAGELGTNAQVGPRQDQSAQAERHLLSALPGEDHHEPACSRCGHRLEYRPGRVLDPFAGTGTTGEAAWREGFAAVLVEREAEYQADIARRMELAVSGRGERRRKAAKARGPSRDLGPLFGDPGLSGGGGGGSTAASPIRPDDRADRPQAMRG